MLKWVVVIGRGVVLVVGSDGVVVVGGVVFGVGVENVGFGVAGLLFMVSMGCGVGDGCFWFWLMFFGRGVFGGVWGGVVIGVGGVLIR